MRWQREWRRGVADVEYLVFSWHGHIVSDVSVGVKFLIDCRLLAVCYTTSKTSDRIYERRVKTTTHQLPQKTTEFWDPSKLSENPSGERVEKRF